jgi:hypothetical protein
LQLLKAKFVNKKTWHLSLQEQERKCTNWMIKAKFDKVFGNSVIILWDVTVYEDNCLTKFIYLKIFIRIYLLYRRHSLWQFQIGLHCTLVRSPHHLCTSTLSLPHLKQLQEFSSFYFVCVYEVHQPYSITVISIHPPAF